MGSHHNPLKYFTVFLLIVSILTVPALAADTVTINFQDLNVVQDQTFKIFNDTGGLIYTGNTGNDTLNSFDLNYNTSTFYTIQFQPGVSNMDTVTMFDNIFAWISDYGLIIVLIVGLLVAITRKW